MRYLIVISALCWACDDGGSASDVDATMLDQGELQDAAPDLGADAPADSHLPDADPPDAMPPDAMPPDAMPDSNWVLDPRDPVEPIAPRDPADFEQPAWPDEAEGDLLLSVAGRGCLSVAGSVQPGAPVEVGACRGVDGQRWLLDDGRIRPEVAPDLCLRGDDWFSPITLGDCDAIAAPFAYDDEGILRRGDVAVDVTADLDVIVYGVHGGANQRWGWLADDVAFLAENGFAVEYPFDFDDERAYAVETARARVDSVQPPYPAGAPRDVSAYPGAVDPDAPPAAHRIHLDRRFDHNQGYLRVAWPPQHWQSTGLYAPAGGLIIVDVPADADANGLAVRINVHTDVLEPTSGNVRDGTFDRFPQLSIRVPLEPGANAVRSAYGGTIILESTQTVDETLPIDVHGAVAMPRFVLGVTSADEWTERRALGAPWAELEGDRAIITVPADKIRDLDDPARTMALYDRIVELEAELFGLDGEGTDRLYDGKARFVEDLQISAGWGHSGFPVMAHLGWDLAELGIGGDDWGVWHELGHNHQQFCLWSTRFGVESTVNLFSLYVQENLTGENRVADRYQATIDAVANGMSFDEADVWQQLVFLTQPVLAFDARWAIYQTVHRRYRALSDEQARMICSDENAQVGTFAVFMSEASGHDLTAWFDAWGLPLTPAWRTAVSDLALPPPPEPVEQTQP